MKIYQILPVLSYGDAIGNDALALYKVIEVAGYETHIYAEVVDSRISSDICSEIKEFGNVEKEDIVFYHLSTGSELNYQIANLECKVVVIYHNITPPSVFGGYNREAYRNCRRGYAGATFLKDKVVYALADSEFNKEKLVKMGYQCEIDVLPILIPFDDYKRKPSNKIIEQYGDGKTNIIFTGRIAPNKKQEDIIAAFAMYKKYYDPEARLILVGAYAAMPRYYEQLKQYVKELQVRDVLFTGHISFDEILAYYQVADCFLCMSEHEGFCVPLVEAMYFNIPIIAYDSTAIADTLGESGWLLKEKDPNLTAGVIHYLLSDSKIRDKIIRSERKRLENFEYSAIQKKFYTYLDKILSLEEKA
mgnify:CR=1 FL=1